MATKTLPLLNLGRLDLTPALGREYTETGQRLCNLSLPSPCAPRSAAPGAPALALGAGESARPFYLHHLSISRDAPGAPALRAGGCPVPPWRRMRAVERTGLDICTTAGAQQPRRCFFLIEWNEHTGKRRCTRAPRAPRLAGRVGRMLRYGLLTSFRLEI